MAISNHPRAAIFDVEGTLVDCVPLILESWRQALQSAGYSFSHRDLQPYSGMDGPWMLEQLLPQESEDVRGRLVKLQGELYEDEFIERAQAFPQVRELFETLKAHGVAIGIGTTCKKEDLAVYDRQLRALELADAISCGDTVKHGKPDPALFRDCLKRLKLEDASSAVAIGDTPFDALAAKAAKMRSVGVLTGGFAADALLDAGCEEVFDRVERVLRVWYTEGAVTVTGGSP